MLLHEQRCFLFQAFIAASPAANAVASAAEPPTAAEAAEAAPAAKAAALKAFLFGETAGRVGGWVERTTTRWAQKLGISRVGVTTSTGVKGEKKTQVYPVKKAYY